MNSLSYISLQGQFGLIQYSITHIVGRATETSTAIDEVGAFSIDSFTGAIYVNTDLERELMTSGIHYYDITVCCALHTPLECQMGIL